MGASERTRHRPSRSLEQEVRGRRQAGGRDYAHLGDRQVLLQNGVQDCSGGLRHQRHCGIKCEVDVLSSHWSRRLPRFYAEFHTKGAEARDAFSHTWPVGTELWIHAETSQLLSIMEKARDQAAKGLLLTAYFPARADFVLFWEQQGPDLQLLIKSPFRFEAPAWRTNSCFNGLSAFDCCVFRFNYSGR